MDKRLPITGFETDTFIYTLGQVQVPPSLPSKNQNIVQNAPRYFLTVGKSF